MAITGKNNLTHKYIPPSLPACRILVTSELEQGKSAGSQQLRRLMCPHHSSWGHFFPGSFRGQLIQKRQSPIEKRTLSGGHADPWGPADHPLPRRGQRPAARWAQPLHRGEHCSHEVAAPDVQPVLPALALPALPTPSPPHRLLTGFSFHFLLCLSSDFLLHLYLTIMNQLDMYFSVLRKLAILQTLKFFKIMFANKQK